MYIWAFIGRQIRVSTLIAVIEDKETPQPTYNGLESEISRTFLDLLHLGHEFFVISGHGT